MTQLDHSRISTAKLISVVVDGDHYYGVSSAAVPFKWESQPGTPRRLLNSPVSAPLTPPPSYFYASSSSSSTKPNTCFRPKNRGAPSSPAAYSSSSSSSSTSSPVRTQDLYGRNSRRSMWYGSAFSSGCYASIVNVFLRDIK